MKWHTEVPNKPGLFKCKVNGEPKVLQFKKCPFTHRWYWLNIDGSDLDPNAKVVWTDGKIFD